jgi:2-keto-4-pentenoate hydratase
MTGLLRITRMSGISARVKRCAAMAEPPATIAAGVAAQLAARRAALDAGARRVGWKLAYGIAEIEELVGAEPVIGHITSATLLEPGATYRGASADRELRVETELAVAVGEGGAVAGLAVALEIVDVGRPPHGAQALIAANVLHRAVAFARTRPGVTTPGGRARLLIGGDVREEAPVRGDPAEVVAATAGLLRAAGERLEAGDLILAGSSCHVPAGPGDAVVAAIDGLGAVGATIAP